MLIIKFIPSSFSDDTISKIFSDVIFRLSLSNPFILVLRWLTKVVNFWYNFGFFIFIPRNLTGLKREWSCFKMLPALLLGKKNHEEQDTIEKHQKQNIDNPFHIFFLQRAGKFKIIHVHLTSILNCHALNFFAYIG